MNKNPNPYAIDNLRYHNFDYYLKTTYQNKVMKIPLDAGFTCPNRDGTVAYGGCSFCSSEGSGELITNKSLSLLDQYYKVKSIMSEKWPQAKTIPYFQAYSNTYDSLANLKDRYELFLNIPEVVGIAIATRPDCINQEIIDYLVQLSKKTDIYLELGLQTIHETTARNINRGYTLNSFENAYQLVKDTPLKICVHIINGLPFETKEMMLETAEYLSNLNIHSLKIHMLHLLNDSKMGKAYLKESWPLLEMKDYVEIVVKQLEILPATLVIQRLTGDGYQNKLIAPIWTTKKTITLNEIQKLFVKTNSYQGKLYEEKKKGQIM